MKKIKNIIKNIRLCIKYPFLYPRNVYTGLHYNDWDIINYLKELYPKAYKGELVHDKYEIHTISIVYACIYKMAEFYHDYVLQLFHCIPLYTWYDQIPYGWKKAFGKELCEDLKKELIKHNYLYDYRITDIKEKYAELRIYDNGVPKDSKIYDIINYYEALSSMTCIECGKKAEYMSKGYILPYCEDCRFKNQSYHYGPNPYLNENLTKNF